MNQLSPVLRALLALLLAALVGGAAHAQALTPFDAVYKVKMKGLRGEMRMSLSHGAGGYAASSVLEPRGLASLFAGGRIHRSADFAVRDGRVVPLEFRSTDTVARDDRASHIDYDWTDGRARGADEDGEFDHPLDANTFDSITLQYALMLDLADGSESADYAMVDGSRFKPLEVRVISEQTVEVPFGEFDVIGVQHQTVGSSRVTTLWCARELGFLPVRIEQHRKGKRTVLAEMTAYQH